MNSGIERLTNLPRGCSLHTHAEPIANEDAGQTIAEHVEDAVGTIGDFWETGLAQDTAENAIEWIKDEGYAMSRSELEGAAMALAGIATIAIDWIKVEVVRDFFQIMS